MLSSVKVTFLSNLLIVAGIVTFAEPSKLTEPAAEPPKEIVLAFAKVEALPTVMLSVLILPSS